jgi:hypothetical protein
MAALPFEKVIAGNSILTRGSRPINGPCLSPANIKTQGSIFACDFVTVLDLFNNPRNNAIIFKWEGERRQRTPKKLFLSGCTG